MPTSCCSIPRRSASRPRAGSMTCPAAARARCATRLASMASSSTASGCSTAPIICSSAKARDRCSTASSQPEPPRWRAQRTEVAIARNWDAEADVVVVGLGAAGVAASITAHDLGAKVVILEKAPEGQEGGNTRVAGQGYLNTSSAEKAAAYLTALCGPYTVPEPMVQVLAEEMCRNNAWLESLGGDPQEHQHPPVGIEFPDLPGSDCVHKFHDGPTYGYSNTWKLFERLVKQRPIPILY